MDIEALIAKHRRRLDEHKTDLSAPASPTRDGPRPGGPGGSALVKPTAPVPSDRLTHGAAVEDAEAAMAAAGTAVDGDDEMTRAVNAYRATDRLSAPRGNSRDPKRFDGGVYRTARAASYTEDYSDEHEDPREASRYVVQSHTGLYDRAQAWQRHRDRNIAQQAHEKAREEISECSFHPDTSAAAATRDRSLAGGSVSLASGITAGAAATESPGFHRHVQRQAGARQEKIQAEQRLVPDIAKWRPTVTEPQEFRLGQRDNPIRSLRKPVVSAALGATPRSARSHAEPTFDSTTASRATTAASTPRGAHLRGSFSNTEEAAPFQRQRSNSTGTSRRGGAGGRDTQALRERNEELEAAVETQRHDISKLNETVAGLQRELEAAKAKIRQLAFE